MGFLSSKTDYTAQPVQTFSPFQNNTTDASNAVGVKQQQLAQALQAMSEGRGPSLAQDQLKNATTQNINQGAGMIASQKGINPALAARMILDNTANANAGAADASAQLRSKEQMGALGALGGALNQERSGDINQLSTVGNLTNAYNTGNIQNSLGTQGINANIATSNAQGSNALLGGLFGAGGGAFGSIVSAGKNSGGSAHGGVIEGTAKVAGDSPENDTVVKSLSPGEIVIPRSKAKDPEKAKEFIEALQKEKKKKAGGEGYSKVLHAHQQLSDRLEMLEKLCYGGMVA